VSSGALFIIWEILLKSKFFDESWRSSPKFVDPSHHQHEFDKSWRRALQKGASDSIKNVKCWRRTLHFLRIVLFKIVFFKKQDFSQVGGELPNLWICFSINFEFVNWRSSPKKRCVRLYQKNVNVGDGRSLFDDALLNFSYLQKSRFFISWRSSQIYGSAPPSTSNC